MHRILFEAARALVTVQTLRISESTRDANRRRIRWRAYVLHVNPLQSLQLVLQRAVDWVVRVAGIAGHVRRNAMILKMLGGNVAGIIHAQALSVRDYRVARNAERRLFGALYVCVHPTHDAQRRKHAQPNERQNLPARSPRQRRTDQENRGQHNAQDNLTDQNPNHRTSFGRLDDPRRRSALARTSATSSLPARECTRPAL